MTVKLYALPGSHPCAAVAAALKLKGIDYRRIDLLPSVEMLAGPLLYGGRTVPGMRIDGERIVGSRAIMRRLDALVPEPALLPPPGNPAHAQVLEAERWGDEVLQSVPRRILDVAFLRRPSTMESYVGDAKLPLLLPLLHLAAPLVAPLAARTMAFKNKARDESARADIAALPALLDQVDAWIADGLLGGDPPNAADLQIGSTIRLLQTILDIRPLLAGPPARPATQLTRYFPPMAGEIPAGVLPAAWLPASAAGA